MAMVKEESRQSVSQSVSRSVGQSVSRSVSQSVSQSVCQSVSQSVSQKYYGKKTEVLEVHNVVAAVRTWSSAFSPRVASRSCFISSLATLPRGPPCTTEVVAEVRNNVQEEDSAMMPSQKGGGSERRG